MNFSRRSSLLHFSVPNHRTFTESSATFDAIHEFSSQARFALQKSDLIFYRKAAGLIKINYCIFTISLLQEHGHCESAARFILKRCFISDLNLNRRLKTDARNRLQRLQQVNREVNFEINPDRMDIKAINKQHAVAKKIQNRILKWDDKECPLAKLSDSQIDIISAISEVNTNAKAVQKVNKKFLPRLRKVYKL